MDPHCATFCAHRGFCTDAGDMMCHPVVEMDGKEYPVVACKHPVNEDHFICRMEDGSHRLIIYDVDGDILMDGPVSEYRAERITEGIS